MITELGGSVFEITHDLVGDLFRAKNAGVTAVSYSLIKFVVTLDSPKIKAVGRAFDLFDVTRSFRSASTSSISSSSDLISPSSRFPDPPTVGEDLSSAGWEVLGS
jgi:hypothetical protein